MTASTWLTPWENGSLTAIDDVLSWRARLRISALATLRCRVASALWCGAVTLIGAVVHAWGMSNFPVWTDDEGTYLSQAWAVEYLHQLSPYSYFYDHAPAGWIQIAVWATVSRGFTRYHSAMAFGNECMLIAATVSFVLLFVVARRLGFARPIAAFTVLVFALSPLALHYTRILYLDNLVTPWLLLALAFAYSPRRSLAAGIGAGLSFAMAALTKETVIVLLPVMVVAMVLNSDRRNRMMVWLLATLSFITLAGAYPMLAILKGELFAGPGHNSLLATAAWQLAHRASTGSLLTAASATRAMSVNWYHTDPFLVAAGAVGALLILAHRRLWPISLALAIQVGLLFRNGYVPYMYIIGLLPFLALAMGGGIATVAGLQPRIRARAALPGTDAGLALVVGRSLVALSMVVGFAIATGPSWQSAIHYEADVTVEPPLELATTWLANNAPRNSVLVVHDAMWTDLVQDDGFVHPYPIIASKLDADPAVSRTVSRIDYLAVPDWYYQVSNADSLYPTLMAARDNSLAMVSYGTGHNRVTVYEVAPSWRAHR